MLTRVDVDTFRAKTGADVRLLVKARDNGGVEFATFTYAGDDLDPLTIDGHPACEFTVQSGTQILRCVVTAGGPQGRYDLFEVFDDGTEVDLEEEIDPTFGPVHQIFIAGVTAMKAAKPKLKKQKPGPGKTAKKAGPTKPAPKDKAAKPAVKKATVKKPAAKKPVARKRTVKKAKRPAAKKAASKRKSPRSRR